MNDVTVHIALFLAVSAAIVLCGAFYSEPDDQKAFKLLPKRFLWFVGGCLILLAVVLLIEHTVASVS
ncbi:MAG: hypothetical protein SGI72_01560 [Planctomycetota bacterium]|nr:hypothetical protein [Planctomycetota bacterium]